VYAVESLIVISSDGWRVIVKWQQAMARKANPSKSWETEGKKKQKKNLREQVLSSGK
jgi:hypothetical protein